METNYEEFKLDEHTEERIVKEARVRERHRILREVYRHYLDFYDYCRREGKDSIEYAGITINIEDLKAGISELAGRKKQAFYLHVLQDLLQRDVAEIMGITTVSVGQYVDAACRQLAEIYWGDSVPKKVVLSDFLGERLARGTKVCFMCAIEKDLDEYDPEEETDTIDGLKHSCRDCCINTN